MRTADDVALVASWRTGDRAAGDELIQRYAAPLYGFFAPKVGAAAEDLTQQVFLALLEGVERFGGRSSFRTYVFAVARRKLYSYFREQSRHSVPPSSPSPLVDSRTSPSERLARGEMHELLRSAMSALPLDQQIALEMSYWERLRPDEVATVLEIPRNTVYTRLRRAREGLKEALCQLEPELQAVQVNELLRSVAADKRD